MVNLDIFQVATAHAALKAKLTKGGIVQFYEYGLAPEKPSLPYVVWQQVDGDAYINLDSVSSADRLIVEFNVYSNTGADVKLIVNMLREALELRGYPDDIGGFEMQPSGVFKYTLDFSFHVTL